MIFVGIDWSETHHDVCVMDVGGRVLSRGRVPEGVEGAARLHEMVATHAADPSEVAVGIEIDRGLLVGTLVAAGYAVHAVNPLSVDRYRDRHRVSGAKSDPGVRPGPGRSGPNRPAPAPEGGGGHRASRRREGASPGPPEPDLVPAASAEPAQEHPAGVLPRSSGGLRDRPGLGRCLGRARPCPHSRHGPIAVGGSDRHGAEERRPRTPGRRAGRRDPVRPSPLPARGAGSPVTGLRGRWCAPRCASWPR